MNKYLVQLTECVSDQVLTDLDAFDVKIFWASEYLQGFVAVETEKTKEELENHFLFEHVQEAAEGEYLR